MRGRLARTSLALSLMLSPFLAAQQQTPTPPGPPEPHRPPRPAPSKPPSPAPEIPKFPDRSSSQASAQKVTLPDLAENRVDWKRAGVFVVFLYALYAGGRWLWERMRRRRGPEE